MLLVAALVSILGAVELRWESAAGCPDAAVVGRDLDALLGERPREDAAEVTGRLEADQSAYVLRLEVARAGRREARELRANDCAVLTRAGVLVVAVTVDALAATAAVDAGAGAAPEDAAGRVPEPVVVAPGPPPRSTTVAEPRPSAAAFDLRPRSRRGSATLAASAGIAQGMTPGVAGGIAGQLGWRRGGVQLEAAAFHWFSRSTALRPAVGIESALSGASLRGCVAFERARLEVPLCTGIDLAAMHGGGVGAAVQRRDALDLWVGVAAGAGLAFWPIRRLALRAQAEGVLGARRPAMYLVIEGEPQEVFRMPPVGVRLVVGPMIRLW